MTSLVVVPIYNEREALPRFIDAMSSVLEIHDMHVLFVDDPSTDGTREYLDELAKTTPRVFVLHRNTPPRGLGRAYVDGFHWGIENGYPIMIEMDCDLSHDPKVLPVMIEKLGPTGGPGGSNGFDFVVGSRYVGDGGTVDWPWYRKLISRLGGFYARTVLGLPIRDFTAGFVGWRSSVLAHIMTPPIASDGYSFQVEVKYRALRRGFSFLEIPIIFREREHGDSKMTTKIVVEAVVRVLVWRLCELAEFCGLKFICGRER